MDASIDFMGASAHGAYAAFSASGQFNVPASGRRLLSERLIPSRRMLYERRRRLSLVDVSFGVTLYVPVQVQIDFINSIIDVVAAWWLPAPLLILVKDFVVEALSNFNVQLFELEWFPLVSILPRLKIAGMWKGDEFTLELDAPGSLTNIKDMVVSAGRDWFVDTFGWKLPSLSDVLRVLMDVLNSFGEFSCDDSNPSGEYGIYKECFMRIGRMPLSGQPMLEANIGMSLDVCGSNAGELGFWAGASALGFEAEWSYRVPFGVPIEIKPGGSKLRQFAETLSNIIPGGELLQFLPEIRLYPKMNVGFMDTLKNARVYVKWDVCIDVKIPWKTPRVEWDDIFSGRIVGWDDRSCSASWCLSGSPDFHCFDWIIDLIPEPVIWFFKWIAGALDDVLDFGVGPFEWLLQSLGLPNYLLDQYLYISDPIDIDAMCKVAPPTPPDPPFPSPPPLPPDPSPPPPSPPPPAPPANPPNPPPPLWSLNIAMDGEFVPFGAAPCYSNLTFDVSGEAEFKYEGHLIAEINRRISGLTSTEDFTAALNDLLSTTSPTGNGWGYLEATVQHAGGWWPRCGLLANSTGFATSGTPAFKGTLRFGRDEPDRDRYFELNASVSLNATFTPDWLPFLQLTGSPRLNTKGASLRFFVKKEAWDRTSPSPPPSTPAPRPPPPSPPAGDMDWVTDKCHQLMTKDPCYCCRSREK